METGNYQNNFSPVSLYNDIYEGTSVLAPKYIYVMSEAITKERGAI